MSLLLVVFVVLLRLVRSAVMLPAVSPEGISPDGPANHRDTVTTDRITRSDGAVNQARNSGYGGSDIITTDIDRIKR